MSLVWYSLFEGEKWAIGRELFTYLKMFIVLYGISDSQSLEPVKQLYSLVLMPWLRIRVYLLNKK